jgi:hypothetical protein
MDSEEERKKRADEFVEMMNPTYVFDEARLDERKRNILKLLRAKGVVFRNLSSDKPKAIDSLRIYVPQAMESPANLELIRSLFDNAYSLVALDAYPDYTTKYGLFPPGKEPKPAPWDWGTRLIFGPLWFLFGGGRRDRG